MKRALVLALAIVIVACGRDSATPTQPTPTPPTQTAISATARAYLEQVVTIMQGNSINRLTIDWAALRAQVFEVAGAAQTIPDTYPAIRTALGRLADDHSAYRSADGASLLLVRNRSCASSGGPARPAGLPATIGYVSVGSFSGTAAEATTFANNIQAVIRGDDRDRLAGWIVDLRGNGGGNMSPMIAGLGPVLGEGLLGFFISPTGATTSWEYRDGASYSGANAIQRVDNPYRVQRDRPRVAVLSDTAVASSGEATLIAFRQRHDT